MMKRIVLNIVLLSALFSMLHSENLLEIYKHRIHGTQENSHTALRAKDSSHKSLIDDIKTIQCMKKSTFESTVEFRKKRDQAILKLDDRTAFYFKNGSKEYSAGTVQMSHYDPDTQMMSVRFTWDEKLAPLLLGENLHMEACFTLEREEAKRLFSQNKKQFFHIRFIYLNNKLTLSEILLYNKYVLYKSVHVKRSTISYSKPIKKLNSEKEKQNTKEKPEMLVSKLNMINEPNKESKIVNKMIKDNSDSNFYGSIIVMFIFIILIISIVVLIKNRSRVSKMNLNNNTSYVSTQSSKFITKSVVTKKSKKTNYREQLHNFALKNNTSFKYKETKTSKNEFTIQILYNNKLIAKKTAKSRSEAREKAAVEALAKINQDKS